VRQIVENLLSTAVKFTPQGGRVEVAVKRESQMAELMVRDTGIGIPPSVLPHVFEAFAQGGEAAGRFAGLGLGLAIVRQLAEAHGATITAQSAGEGRGATFRRQFP